MLFSLILGLGLVATANSFKFQSEEYVNNGDFFDKRCVKALTTDIECDQYTRMIGQYSSMGWSGSNTTADCICFATCFDSLQKWNQTVNTECAKDLSRAFPPYQLEDIVKLANKVRCQEAAVDDVGGETDLNVSEGAYLSYIARHMASASRLNVEDFKY